jgi:3-deoxy-manno-octulosonate cytidylyltransferase (CMP-KDO synthetase)
MEAARRGGAQAVLTREDHQSGTDRIAEAAEKLDDGIIVNLQADEPEMEPDAILAVARLLADASKGVSMATLAVPILDEDLWRKPSVVKVVVDRSGQALYFSRAPIPFVRGEVEASARERVRGEKGREHAVYGLHHLGIYAYRRDFLLGYSQLPSSRLEELERLEQLRALEAGHRIRVGVVKSCPPGIDTEEEYEAFVERFRAASA